MNPRPLDELVDTASEWGALDWWKLEVRSLDAAPYVQSDLAILAPPEAVQAEYSRVTAGSVIQGLSYLYLLIGPLIGAILMFRWSSDGAGDGMPLAAAGVLTAIALAITGYSEIQDRLHPRAVSVRAAVTIAALQVVPGIVTVVIALGPGRDQLAGGRGWWLAVIGVEMLAHVLIALRARILPAGSGGIVANVRAGVAELDSGTLQALVSRRGQALERLHERGLIGDADLERARQSPIGELGMTMAPQLAKAYRPRASR